MGTWLPRAIDDSSPPLFAWECLRRMKRPLAKRWNPLVGHLNCCKTVCCKLEVTLRRCGWRGEWIFQRSAVWPFPLAASDQLACRAGDLPNIRKGTQIQGRKSVVAVEPRTRVLLSQRPYCGPKAGAMRSNGTDHRNLTWAEQPA